MNVKVKSNYFITLAEAKKHLRVDVSFTDEDSFITQLIEAATGFAENYIEKDIASTVNTKTILEFSGDEILIQEGNYKSVTSVTGSISGALTFGDNAVKYDDSTFTITLDNEITTEETLTVVFETGYTLSTYPKQIRQAILIKIHDLYDPERGSFNIGVLKTNDIFESLLNFYVKMRFV